MDKVEISTKVEDVFGSSSADPYGNNDKHYKNHNDQEKLLRRASLALKRTASKASRMSRRSYMSNLSVINRKNLARFGRSKITFLVVNSIFTFFGLSVSLFSIFTWMNNFYDAPLIRLVSEPVLISLTFSSFLMAFTGFTGFMGAFTHRKFIVSFYILLTWPVLFGWITAGYLTYSDRHSSQWEQLMSTEWDAYTLEKQLIQYKFGCCGYLSNLDRPFVDDQCTGIVDYASTTIVTTTINSSAFRRLRRRQVDDVLERETATQVVTSPSCHGPWTSFVANYLEAGYSVSFSMVPLCLVAFTIGLLAANHIYD